MNIITPQSDNDGRRKRPTKQAKAGGVGGIYPPPVETRFKPGQSGNPSGRPKGGKSITAALRHLIDDGLDGKDLAEELARLAIKRAMQGDFKFWDAIVERIDGKVVEKIESEVKAHTLKLEFDS